MELPGLATQLTWFIWLLIGPFVTHILKALVVLALVDGLATAVNQSNLKEVLTKRFFQTEPSLD